MFYGLIALSGVFPLDKTMETQSTNIRISPISLSLNGNILPWTTLGFEIWSALDNQCIPGVTLWWNVEIYSAVVASFYVPLLRLMISSVFPEWLSTIPTEWASTCCAQLLIKSVGGESRSAGDSTNIYAHPAKPHIKPKFSLWSKCIN